MTVLRESPWYQEILKEGLETGEKLGFKQGFEEGFKQGFEQGFKQGELSLILRQIHRRFREIESNLELKIRGLAIPELEALGVSLFDFGRVDDLVAWLNQLDN